MNKCTNSRIGALIHAYELNQLSLADEELFELHLLECEACFEDLNSFEDAAVLLRTDSNARSIIAEVANTGLKANGFGAKLRSYLWPETALILRPAILYTIICLLIYPAYQGLRISVNLNIRSINAIALIPERSSVSSYSISGHDVSLNFLCPGSIPGKIYRVTLKYSDKIIFQSSDFNNFDSHETGRLLVPSYKLIPGMYELMVEDATKFDTSPEIIYRFTIN